MSVIDWSAGLTARDWADGVVDVDVDGDMGLVIATRWAPATQWYQSYVHSPTFPGIGARDWGWDTYVFSSNPGNGCWLWVPNTCTINFDIDVVY
jgi:hypothetical protein